MGNEHWYGSKLRDLDRDECIRLLQTQQVGRVVFSDDSGPDVLPVNYVMDGEDVLISTTGYGALARAATDGRVAFEIDAVDDYTETGWSVVVRGRATRESPFDAPAQLPQPWVDGSRTYLLRISPDTVSGRRLIPT